MAKGVVKLGTGVGRRARNDGHSHTVSGPGSDGKESRRSMQGRRSVQERDRQRPHLRGCTL
eukprot:123850-Rhodomonas_salina.1